MSGTAARIGNIGPRGRRTGLLFGVVMLGIGLAVFVLDIATASRWWLAVMFGFFWTGALGVLQGRGHT